MGCVHQNQPPPNYENVDMEDEAGYVRPGYSSYEGPQMLKTHFYTETRQVSLTSDMGTVTFHVESALHVALNLLQTYRDNATGGLDSYFLKEVQRIVTDSENMKNRVGIYRGESHPTTRHVRRPPFDDANYRNNAMEPYTPSMNQTYAWVFQQKRRTFDMQTLRLQSTGKFQELRQHLGCPHGPPPPRSGHGQCDYCGHYKISHAKTEFGAHSCYA